MQFSDFVVYKSDLRIYTHSLRKTFSYVFIGFFVVYLNGESGVKITYVPLHCFTKFRTHRIPKIKNQFFIHTRKGEVI